MIEGTKMEIRSDLRDISNTIMHLAEIGDSCGRAYWQFENMFKNRDDKGSSLLDQLGQLPCRQFAYIIEELYKRGSSAAELLCHACKSINRVQDCPNLHDYVEILHACQTWIEPDTELLSRCEDAIKNRAYEVNYEAIEDMIFLHEDQLKLLAGLDADIYAIQTSERYGIEQAASVNAWVTVTEAAASLGVSVGHASRLVDQRKIIGNGQKGKSRRVSKISVSEYKRKKLEKDQLRDTRDHQKDLKKMNKAL